MGGAQLARRWQEMAAPQRTWPLHAVAFALVVGVAAASDGCAHKPRRMFTSCTVNDDCDSNQCTDGVCSRSCVTNDVCEGGVCIEQKCVAIGTKCDDHSKCTVNDLATKDGCAGAAISCDESTPCQQIFCEPKIGCAANAKNIGSNCEGSPLKACAAGGLATGGCKCSVWQSNPIGPYDKVTLKDGATTIVAVGTVALRAVQPAGDLTLLVGSARQAEGQPSRGWLAAVNATQQGIFSVALPPADVTATNDTLHAAASTASRYLLVGKTGDNAWLATLANPLAVGQGQEALVSHGIAVKQGVPLPVAASLDTGGSFAVVGAVGDSGMMLRGKLFDDGDFADPVQNVLKSATAGAGDGSQLAGVATHPKGWLAVGTSVESGKSMIWLVYTEAGFGGSLASETLQPVGVVQSAGAGVLRRNNQWLIFGTATGTNGTVTGYVAALDQDHKVVWQQLLGPNGKPPADAAKFVAAVPFNATQWLLIMAFGKNGVPWAVRTDGVTPVAQPIGGASALAAVTAVGASFVVAGDQGARAFVQRIGPNGEVACTP